MNAGKGTVEFYKCADRIASRISYCEEQKSGFINGVQPLKFNDDRSLKVTDFDTSSDGSGNGFKMKTIWQVCETQQAAFQDEIMAINMLRKTRGYLEKQGICTVPINQQGVTGSSDEESESGEGQTRATSHRSRSELRAAFITMLAIPKHDLGRIVFFNARKKGQFKQRILEHMPDSKHGRK